MKLSENNPAWQRNRQGGTCSAQALSCVLCLMLFSLGIYAQKASQSNTSADDRDARLELKLSTQVPGICGNASLPLFMELTNGGELPIKIHKSSLWSQFQYLRLGTEFGGRSISCGLGGDGAEHWLVLEPGAKYFDSFNYLMEGASFFQAIGTYRISTTLPYYIGDKPAGNIKSGEVEFEIYDCTAK